MSKRGQILIREHNFFSNLKQVSTERQFEERIGVVIICLIQAHVHCPSVPWTVDAKFSDFKNGKTKKEKKNYDKSHLVMVYDKERIVTAISCQKHVY